MLVQACHCRAGSALGIRRTALREARLSYPILRRPRMASRRSSPVFHGELCRDVGLFKGRARIAGSRVRPDCGDDVCRDLHGAAALYATGVSADVCSRKYGRVMLQSPNNFRGLLAFRTPYVDGGVTDEAAIQSVKERRLVDDAAPRRVDQCNRTARGTHLLEEGRADDAARLRGEREVNRYSIATGGQFVQILHRLVARGVNSGQMNRGGRASPE